jgi:hypothetical protein
MLSEWLTLTALILLRILISVTASTSQLDSIFNAAEFSGSVVMINRILSILLLSVLGLSISINVVIPIFLLRTLSALAHCWKWV